MSNIRTGFIHSNPSPKNKYNEGDVLLVTTWDQGDEVWKTGTIQIVEYSPVHEYTEYGVYITRRLSGDITWLCVNAKSLDEEPDVKILGNVHTDSGWKVLYGGSKQRT